MNIILGAMFWTTVMGYASCTVSTLQVAPLDCMHVVKENVLRMHYKNNLTAQTLHLCFENLKDSGFVAAGPGQGMAMGTRAVVAATGHDQNNVFDITVIGLPTQFFADFGHTKLQNLVQNGRRINCFQMPYSRLDPNADSISEANFAWAVGGEAFRRHRERGVFKFNFRSDGLENVKQQVPVAIIAHVACMMSAILIFYPLGILPSMNSGLSFHRGKTLLNIHITLMSMVTLLTIAGLVFALYESKVDTVHGFIGIIVSVSCFLQPINAFFRPSADHRLRHTWKFVHRGIGRIYALLGLFAVLDGVFAFDDKYGHFTLLLLIVLVPLVVFSILWLVLYCRQQTTIVVDS